MKIPNVGTIGSLALLAGLGYIAYKVMTGGWKIPSLPSLPSIPDIPELITPPRYVPPPDMPPDIVPSPMPIAPPTLPQLIFPPLVLIPGEPEIIPKPTMPPSIPSLIFPPLGFIDLMFPRDVPGKPKPVTRKAETSLHGQIIPGLTSIVRYSGR